MYLGHRRPTELAVLHTRVGGSGAGEGASLFVVVDDGLITELEEAR